MLLTKAKAYPFSAHAIPCFRHVDEIKPSKWANSEPHRVPAEALTTEADVAEDIDENKEVK
ncbi:hypothetical protein DVH24_029576 [Malus domestica]|uniref:Uncharacterized protein n=1 Tax=Malus domestica TaxID=3750 RepID=A0A498HZ30_MALDO|nr:hypothetical protein DVH24_029576 [Malus domestica]